jgi:hypothetical protein
VAYLQESSKGHSNDVVCTRRHFMQCTMHPVCMDISYEMLDGYVHGGSYGARDLHFMAP